MLCMKAYTIVEPTNVTPRFLRSFEKVSDSGVRGGSWPPGCFRRVDFPATKLHAYRAFFSPQAAAITGQRDTISVS